MLRRLLREDEGFSLIELLMTMALGTMVLGALSMVFIRTTAATTEAQNRIETSQNGRVAIDRMTQVLDSQTCLLSNDSTGNSISTPPIVSGDGDSVTFYADLSPSSSSISPDKYMYTYSPTAKTITESRWPAIGNEPSLSYATNPTTVRTLVSNITYARDAGDAQVGVFKYYTFPTSGLDPAPLASPLTTGTTGTNKQVTQISIQFQPLARKKNAEDSRRSSTISGLAYLQTADPDAKTVCP